MASRYVAMLSSAMLLGVSAVSLTATDVAAGQYKTLIAPTVNNAQVGAYSTPKTFGQAVELEFYEFLVPTAGKYRCRITANATNQLLILRMLGVNGANVATCTTAVGGTCDTAALSLVGNLKFVCAVSTQNGAPVASNLAWYRFEVQRVP